MDESMVNKIHDHSASDLDERIKAALDLAEDFILNHARGIDEAWIAKLKEHYSDEEVVELTVAIGIWDSVHKFNNVFDVHLILLDHKKLYHIQNKKPTHILNKTLYLSG